MFFTGSKFIWKLIGPSGNLGGLSSGVLVASGGLLRCGLLETHKNSSPGVVSRNDPPIPKSEGSVYGKSRIFSFKLIY